MGKIDFRMMGAENARPAAVGTFVVLGNAPWNSAGLGGNSSQQYARTLLRLGWEIAYCSPQKEWAAPLPVDLDPSRSTVICDFPYTEHFLEIFTSLAAAGCRSICRVVDHYHSYHLEDGPLRRRFRPDLEESFVRAADQVYASSPLNVDRLKNVRADIALLRNGVDLDHFGSPDLRDRTRSQREGLTLGAVSSFWYRPWIDLEPLLAYAGRNPMNSVELVGYAERVLTGRKAKNVFCHGPMPWRDLPRLMSRFDVGVVPYDPHTTRYTNPIKVLEYLASGIPVVSCYNKSIEDYPYVYFYENTASLEDAVNEALERPVDATQLREFIQEHSWEKRIEEVLSATGCLAGSRQNIPRIPAADSL